MTTTAPLTLRSIADAINDGLSLADVRNCSVENIGGGVYAVLGGWSGLTITINGGQRAVDVATDGPADVLICRDGLGIAARTASTPAEVAALVSSIGAPIEAPAADDVLRTGKPMWSGGIVHISTNGGSTALCGVVRMRPEVAVIPTGPGCDECLRIAEAR